MDLVLVKMENEQNYVFMAPNYSLDEGDMVLVETENGDKEGVVVARLFCVDENDNDYKFITQMKGVTTPLKRVKAQIRLMELDYGKS